MTGKEPPRVRIMQAIYRKGRDAAERGDLAEPPYSRRDYREQWYDGYQDWHTDKVVRDRLATPEHESGTGLDFEDYVS